MGVLPVLKMVQDLRPWDFFVGKPFNLLTFQPANEKREMNK
jgi:hypothetical protein